MAPLPSFEDGHRRGHMLRLKPIDEADFGPFMENLLRSSAAEQIRTGRWTDKEGREAALVPEKPREATEQKGDSANRGLLWGDVYFFPGG